MKVPLTSKEPLDKVFSFYLPSLPTETGFGFKWCSAVYILELLVYLRVLAVSGQGQLVHSFCMKIYIYFVIHVMLSPLMHVWVTLCLLSSLLLLTCAVNMLTA